MNNVVLEKLQWNDLLHLLADRTQTIEGREICENLQPNLQKDEIESRWNQLEPLRNLIRTGYTPPIGDIPILHAVFRGAALGQILDGESLRNVLHLLQAVKNFHRFAKDFQEKCPALLRYQKVTYPLPQLTSAIEKAVSPEGDILDTASPELQRIRRQKVSMRKTIENEIKQLLTNNELETYLQDKFFTIRAERYVIPIRLDGRGRVKGSIHDTSDSGQTLYMEPEVIRPMNETLLELELSEKLEVLRIFRELSAQVAQDVDVLQANYESMIELDVLIAQASLAVNLDAGRVRLSDKPCLKLLEARHPLVKTPGGGAALANTIDLLDKQKILIVSGPNAGGKTIVLKTVGMLHLMAKAGLLLPASPESELYLFENLYIEMGDSQNLAASLSTFSGHVLGLKPILEQACSKDLVLLDELAVGTEPMTGSAIGQAVLEELAAKGVSSVVTTHFDSLKGLAVGDQRYRNGSMEFSTATLKPTYRLILDIPGQSYGIELAEQIGLPTHVIRRAKELRGQSGSSLDQLVEDLQRKKEEADQQRQSYEKLRLEVEAEKHRWEAERTALQKSKAEASEKIKSRYQDQVDDLKVDFHETLEDLKKSLKDLKKSQADDDVWRDVLQQQKKGAEEKLSQLEGSISKLGDDFKLKKEMPGTAASLDDLDIGDRVYVISLDHEATVTKIQKGPSSVIEVSAGLIKLKPALQDLRKLPPEDESSLGKRMKSSRTQAKGPEHRLVLPSLTNSVDLRGLDADRALDRTWAFIDKAVMRGENDLILIHGHGTDKLKKTIRMALAKDSPYNLDFRPGEKEEGGDGVTVVHLSV
ncbi:MAG: endonuclease MutS2 [Oligoflexus sp.]